MRNTRHLRRPRLAAVLAVAAFLSATVVQAHMGAEGVAKERMEAMKTLAGEMKVVALMLRGKRAFDAGRVTGAARTIGRHGAMIVALFPKDSASQVSEASPAIWSDPEGFKKSADSMVGAASRLEAAAAGADRGAVNAAFRALGKTCSACHRDYRVKTERR